MKITFSLTQKNKKGNTSFEAFHKVEDAKLINVSAHVAEFTRDIIELVQSNTKVGYRAAVSGLKKSLPLSLKIQANKEVVTLNYKTFGKFAHEANKEQIEQFLTNNIAFVQKWGNK